MCTALVSLDPSADWPVRIAFVRDEDRSRVTDLPAAWWAEQPSVIGGRDARAGGTWLAVDRAVPAIAMLTDRYDPSVDLADLPDPARSPTRGAVPLNALARAREFQLDADLPGDLVTYQPFHLVHIARDGDGWDAQHWSWDGRELEHVTLATGLHVVASRARSIPGERERRAQILERFTPVVATSPTPQLDGPTADSWGRWLELLDGRDVAPDQFDAMSIHSASIRPGFGTVGATLVAFSRAGEVRYDVNSTTNVDPGAWQRVDVSGAAAPSML